MSEARETSRLVTLTDGQRSKPIKVLPNKCSISFLLKEGKNKFRTKFKHILYPEGNNQVVRKDEDLQLVLTNHDGPLTFLLTNKEPQADETTDEFVVTKTERGLSYMIANEDSIEEEAKKQLKLASELDGCIFAIGMPDLHPGKGIPIGAVVMTQDRIAFPQLVDNDIGCGMSFVETSLGRDKLNMNKLRKLATSLESIDGSYASQEEMLESCAQTLQWGTRTLEPLPTLNPPYHYDKLGTIGGGNHFAELQQFEEVLDAESIHNYGIDTSKVHLLVHSGSRGLGSQYLREFCEKAHIVGDHQSGHYGVATESPLFREYLENHNMALNYAARNRRLIAHRLLEQITPGQSDLVCKIDIYHNYIEKAELTALDAMRSMENQGQFPRSVAPMEDGEPRVGWIHRKGATPTTQSKVLVIPGSRGTLSYLVEVNKDAEHGSGFSLAHGAGRRMNRSKALAKNKSRYPNAKQMLQTDLDSIVLCDKKDLVYEEAPDSYKDIDEVVKCLAEGVKDKDGRGIVRVLATLRPLLTYKYKDPYK